jgi:glucosamine 6-phosphate synthetase-like amidotransferase/phosphosugar isomerase protein
MDNKKYGLVIVFEREPNDRTGPRKVGHMVLNITSKCHFNKFYACISKHAEAYEIEDFEIVLVRGGNIPLTMDNFKDFLVELENDENNLKHLLVKEMGVREEFFFEKTRDESCNEEGVLALNKR